MRAQALALALTFLAAAACGDDDAADGKDGPTAPGSTATSSTVGSPPAASTAMTLLSDVFTNGNYIPKEYSCDGANASPALRWSAAPSATKSFTLIVDDPDAPGGTFVHWVLYDLPATATELARAVPNNPSLGNGAKQGVGGSRKTGYTGPCPPAGKDHRYSFRLYALDTVLNLEPGQNKATVERAMQGHVLAQAEIVGLYRR